MYKQKLIHGGIKKKEGEIWALMDTKFSVFIERPEVDNKKRQYIICFGAEQAVRYLTEMEVGIADGLNGISEKRISYQTGA